MDQREFEERIAKLFKAGRYKPIASIHHPVDEETGVILGEERGLMTPLHEPEVLKRVK